MSELLWDNIEAERRRAMQGESSNNTWGNNPRLPRREILDILSWIQCFGIYSSGHKKVPVPFPFYGAKTVQTVVTLRFL